MGWNGTDGMGWDGMELIDGWMDGRMDGRMDGWMTGLIDVMNNLIGRHWLVDFR